MANSSNQSSGVNNLANQGNSGVISGVSGSDGQLNGVQNSVVKPGFMGSVSQNNIAEDNSIANTNISADDPLLSHTQQPEDLDVRWTRWKCLNCNYIYEGVKPLTVCPRCGNSDPEKFGDID